MLKFGKSYMTKIMCVCVCVAIFYVLNKTKIHRVCMGVVINFSSFVAIVATIVGVVVIDGAVVVVVVID